MARIRTIKPEFPQSETVGSLSRDARLLFIQLWTIADDDGRARGASRMLASLLYPYDDDAPALMEGWLDELERKGCIRRYSNGSAYLEIINWLKHQKIDKPSPSRLPAFNDVSRPLANTREASRTLATDLGPSTLDLGSGSGPILVSSGDETAGEVDPEGHDGQRETPRETSKPAAKAPSPAKLAAAQAALKFTEFRKVYPRGSG
jgi:hypothetical protein